MQYVLFDAIFLGKSQCTVVLAPIMQRHVLMLMAAVLLLLIAAGPGAVARVEQPLSRRGERAMNRIARSGASAAAAGRSSGSISDRVGSLVNGIIQKSAAGSRATTKNTEAQRRAAAKHREVNKARRKMSTYAEKKREATLLRRQSRSLKTGQRRIG